MTTAAELRDWLDIADDDELVISTVMLTADPSVRWVTALFAPREVAAAAWPFADASDAGKDHHLSTAWMGERVNIGTDGDGSWLDPAMGGLLSAVGELPSAEVSLRDASAPLLVTPLARSPLSALVYGVGRPVEAYWFPFDIGPPNPPEQNDAWALTRVTGISVGAPQDGGPCAPGLLVGRLRRRAWIARVRGGPDLSTFDVGIDCDSQSLSYSELVVELEEQIDGEVVQLRRLPLADVQLPAQVPGLRLVVALPTMGPRVRRRVRLWHSEGDLLDQTGLFDLLETITITLSTADGDVTTTTGGLLDPPALEGRVERARLVEAQYEQLIADGLPGRVVTTRKDAEDRILGALGGANGEVLVLDPYFGSGPGDWALLSRVRSARVLTGKAAKGPAPAAVSARKWTNGPPPWHDRFYVWDGGGLSVGTSPSGFGKRAFRIDVLSAAEATTWRSLFEAWWADPAAQPV